MLAAAAGGGMERRTAENRLSGEGPASPRAGPLGSTSVSADACSQGLGGSEGKGPRAPTPSVALWYEGAHSLSCPHCSLVPCGIATSILIFSPFGSPRPPLHASPLPCELKISPGKLVGDSREGQLNTGGSHRPSGDPDFLLYFTKSNDEMMKHIIILCCQ